MLTKSCARLWKAIYNLCFQHDRVESNGNIIHAATLLGVTIWIHTVGRLNSCWLYSLENFVFLKIIIHHFFFYSVQFRYYHTLRLISINWRFTRWTNVSWYHFSLHLSVKYLTKSVIFSEFNSNLTQLVEGLWKYFQVFLYIYFFVREVVSGYCGFGWIYIVKTKAG